MNPPSDVIFLSKSSLGFANAIMQAVDFIKAGW
jgi:hypothetical protein